MLSKIQNYIKEQNLLSSSDRLIVGLSGGADSVVLLYILHQLGYHCIAAHCNFHLRKEESNRDAQFAESYAHSLNITFEKIDFETELYASGKKISIEMAARELRYEWFEKLRENHNAKAIVTAHHQDDSVETFLLNLIRGTGIKGLTGIKPQAGFVARPLLCLSKEEILQYAEKENLVFITDSSNLKDQYTRNKIRLNILPEIKKINPSVCNTILNVMNNLREVESVYNNEINKEKEKVFNREKNRISISLLRSFIEPGTLLFEILKPFEFNSTVVGEIMESIDSQSGKEFYSKSFKVIKDREFLLIVPRYPESEGNNYYEIKKEDISLFQPFQLQIRYIKKTPDFKFINDKNIAYFDAQLLEFPLTFRHWKNGDKFVPFGMNNYKKLSDFFNDKKKDIFQKDKIWLLCCRNDIIWVIGERSDNRYRVTQTTENICEIKIIIK